MNYNKELRKVLSNKKIEKVFSKYEIKTTDKFKKFVLIDHTKFPFVSDDELVEEIELFFKSRNRKNK